MNQLTLILILSSFISLSYANICETPFMPGVNPLYKQDFTLSRKINFYESSISLVKRLKAKKSYLQVNEVKATHKRWFEDFKEIESHIFRGSEDLGIYRLRRPYRNIHHTSSSIEEYEKVLSYLEKTYLELTSTTLDKLGVSKGIQLDLLKRSQKKDIDEIIKYIYKKRRKDYRRLGSYFDEFNYFESNLIKLYKSFECKRDCKAVIDRLKVSLNLNKSLGEVRHIFNSSPHSIVVARKKEFLNESFDFIRNIISRIDFTKSILVSLKHKGIFEKSHLVKLFKSSYDYKARKLHRSIIDKISLAKLTTKQRFDLLKKELITYADESLVVNFARAKDYNTVKAWNEIKDYAKKNKDLDFYNLVLNSELIARKLGRISSYSLTKVLKNTTLIVGAGVGFVYLIGSNNDTSIIEENDVPSTDSIDGEVEEIHLKYGSKEEQGLYLYVKSIVEEISQTLK